MTPLPCAIQRYGLRGGHVELDGRRSDIRAAVRTLGGCPAHADQQDLIDFIAAMPTAPARIILVHGDNRAKRRLKPALSSRYPAADADIG